MFLLVFYQFLLLLMLSACARAASPEGWSGGVVTDEALFIGTMEGDIRAISTTTGDTLWRFEFRGESEDDRALYGTPVIADGILYFGVYDGILYAMTTGGRDVWETRVGDGAHMVGGPVVVDGTVLVGSDDGNMYAFSVSDGTRLWSFPTANKIWSTPAVGSGTVYFGSLDHNVYALSLDDGSLVWSFTANAAVTGTPVLARGRVYVGSFAGDFFAIDAKTGLQVWTFDEAESWFWSGDIADSENIYAPSLDGNLYALDLDNGQLQWTLKTEGAIVGTPVFVGDRIAVPSSDGKVWLASLRDGSNKQQCDIESKLRAPLTEHEGYIYVASTDRSIRRLFIKPNGNPDEEWVHITNKDDPVQLGQSPAC